MIWTFLHHMPCRKIPFLVAIVQRTQNEIVTHLILVDTASRQDPLTSRSRSHSIPFTECPCIITS